jgi:hypothetical protein
MENDMCLITPLLASILSYQDDRRLSDKNLSLKIRKIKKREIKKSKELFGIRFNELQVIRKY